MPHLSHKPHVSDLHFHIDPPWFLRAIISLEKQFSSETQLSLEETFETIAVECSGKLIQTPEYSLKRRSLIDDDILSNPRQIQVYLHWLEPS